MAAAAPTMPPLLSSMPPANPETIDRANRAAIAGAFINVLPHGPRDDARPA